MGYDLHITRAADWTTSAEQPITLAEWVEAVGRIPGLRPDPYINGPEFAAVRVAGEPDGWPLWWHDGRVSTKNPHRAVVTAMIEVAGAFDAHVVGDDGEEYPTADAVPTAAELRTVRRWWWPF